MNKKLALIFFQVLFVLVCFLSLAAKPSSAAFSCLVSPTNFTTTTKPVTFVIDSGGNLADGDYFVSYGGQYIGIAPGMKTELSTVFHPVDGRITATIDKTLSENTYAVGVYSKSADSTNLCQNAAFVVNNATVGGTCKINFTIPSSDFTPTNDIKFYVSGLKDQNDHHYVLYLNKKDGSPVKEGINSAYSLSNSSDPVNLGTFSTGIYYLDLRDGSNFAGLFENTACFATFSVGPNGGGLTGSGVGTSPFDVPPPPPPPCATPVVDSSGNIKGCAGVSTGFDVAIGTSASSFVKSLFGILLSIAGAIAILLIIISGYRIMGSQGDPEKVQHAREQLTAAVVGLLFIILSLVILQFIGVDILGLPGFGN